MNYSIAVFLINRDVRAVLATYEEDQPNNLAAREMFKTLDPTIRAGDLVIVPTNTRHKMTVVKVVETDVDVDFDSSKQAQWVIGRVDASGYDRVLEQESSAIQAIKSAEVRKKRDDLAAALLADNEALKSLPIAKAAETPALGGK